MTMIMAMMTVQAFHHNFGNCILQCIHQHKQNQNLYIPGIVQIGLCYTLTIAIPSCLPVNVNYLDSFGLSGGSEQILLWFLQIQ